MAKINTRTVKLRNVTDGHVYQFEDGGFSANTGQPSATRQQIQHLAAQTVDAKVNGADVVLKVWAWESMPAWDSLTHVDGEQFLGLNKQNNGALAQLFPVWGPAHDEVQAQYAERKQKLRARFVRPLMKLVNEAATDQTGQKGQQLNSMTQGLRGRGVTVAERPSADASGDAGGASDS